MIRMPLFRAWCRPSRSSLLALDSAPSTRPPPPRPRPGEGLRTSHLHRARRQAAAAAEALPRPHHPHLREARHEERRLLGAAGCAGQGQHADLRDLPRQSRCRQEELGQLPPIRNGRRCPPNRRSTVPSSARWCRSTWTPRITRRSSRRENLCVLSFLPSSSRPACGTLSLALGAAPASDPNFTGVVTPMDAKDITGGRRKFESRRRTRPGTVTTRGSSSSSESGRMRTGAAARQLRISGGGSEYTGPNIEHWHGATPGEALVQVNIQFGGTTKWLTKTDRRRISTLARQGSDWIQRSTPETTGCH